MDAGLISRYSTSSKDTKRQPREQRLLEDASSGSRNSGVRFVILGFGALVMTIGGYFLYHVKERKSPIEARKIEPVKVNKTSQKGTIGGPFKLINHKGELVTDRDLVGKWILLYFGYTSSPDTCPEELQKLAEAVQKIEKQINQEIVPVFITIDPERDSVAQIEAYIAEFHPKMVGMTGTVDAIRQVAREYRVYYKKIEEEGSDYLVDHSNVIYLFDPNMDFVKFFGKEYDADSLAAEVVEEIKKRENLGSHNRPQREGG